ncbi:MAG: glycoside hydrolase N-terminal domain-containing protein [Clostridia bacterium]|nr:glycoside hydrolase N-terminal domain-containing protein [Clostridia bacterium]
MELKTYDIKQNGGISQWDKALPLGNGRLGMLLYGTDTLRLSLDRVDLWYTRLSHTVKEPGFTYDNLKQLVQSGKEEDWQEFLRLFNNIYSATAYPSKITAGRLELAFADAFQPDFYLSLETAEACVQDENGIVRMTGFASATDFIGVFRIYGEYSLSFHIPKYISETDTQDGASPSIRNPHNMGYPPAQIVKEEGFTYYRQKTHTDFEYGIVVFEKDCGSWRELYCTITANTDGKNDIAFAKEKLLWAAEQGYTTLMKSHTAWWEAYWAKSEINTGDPMLEQVYYRSQYLFASCSRKGFYPMPLQGVWTADSDSLPPWKGDYHHDTNTQLSYQAYLKANRLPEGEVFLDYLWNLREAFTAYAKNFFGVDGLLIPGVSTIDGKPMGGWPQYSMSPTMSVWTAQSFDEYYLYTGDMDFLQNRAYPFFTEIGKAIEGLLVERDGKLYLPLSSSPEIHDNAPSAYLQPNSNFDLALMRYLYSTLADYAKQLNDEPSIAHWEGILYRLDDIAMDNDHILLTAGEGLQESHRHFSHLMCLYPLHLINFDTPEHKSIYQRTLSELEFLGTGMWVGFSFAMAAQIYAMAQNGNGAYRNLYTFAHGFMEHNGFHVNGDFKHYGYSTFHYRPFTLESSFGFCDALHEMLLQDHMGYIHIFPAIPDEWKESTISFTDLRSRGGVLVSAVREQNGVRKMELKCDTSRTICIRNPFETDTVRMEMYSETETIKAKDSILTVTIPAGVSVFLTC